MTNANTFTLLPSEEIYALSHFKSLHPQVRVTRLHMIKLPATSESSEFMLDIHENLFVDIWVNIVDDPLASEEKHPLGRLVYRLEYNPWIDNGVPGDGKEINLLEYVRANSDTYDEEVYSKIVEKLRKIQGYMARQEMINKQVITELSGDPETIREKELKAIRNIEVARKNVNRLLNNEQEHGFVVVETTDLGRLLARAEKLQLQVSPTEMKNKVAEAVKATISFK